MLLFFASYWLRSGGILKVKAFLVVFRDLVGVACSQIAYKGGKIVYTKWYSRIVLQIM